MLSLKLETALQLVKWFRGVLWQLTSRETTHSNNDAIKENQMACDHIFYESVQYAYSHVAKHCYLVEPTCSMGFMAGLSAGQLFTSTSHCARKAVLSRAVWGVALSWTDTKLSPKSPKGKHIIAEKPDVASKVPYSTYISLLPSSWMAHHTAPTKFVNSLGCRGYEPYIAIIPIGRCQRALAYKSVNFFYWQDHSSPRQWCWLELHSALTNWWMGLWCFGVSRYWGKPIKKYVA